MTSRSWNVRDLSPQALDQAIEASRRSGMGLEDWLNSAISDSARAHGVTEAARPHSPARELSEIHDRLDSITRQIERVSGSAPASGGSVAHQLNDAISRLDQRLAGLSQNAPARPAAATRAGSFDAAVAEIAARQGELDGRARPQRVAAAPVAPPVAPPMADFSGVERRLDRLSEQMGAFRPQQIEQSIVGFREELSGIRRSLTEAMPRRALESIENEIRAVARRLDDSRNNGVDGQALNGIERGLSEIHQTLRTLKPAEQLAGFDAAIANLSSKLDLIVRSSQHGGVHELEAAIGALRSLVSQVASGEAVAQLHSDVQTLAARVDQLVLPAQDPGALSALEQRIALLTEALATRDRPLPADTSGIDNAMRALTERIDRMQVAPQIDMSAIEHLEQRIGSMLQRVEQAIPNNAPLGRIEEGLSHVIAYLENQREGLSTILSAAPPTVPAMNEEIVEAVRRELHDIRFGQSEAERRSQDSLDVVHNALNQVVDRLAVIEKDLQQIKAAPQRAAEPPRAVATAPLPAPAPREMAAPTLPNPVQMQNAPSAATPRPALRAGAVPEESLVPAFTDEARPAAPPAQRPASAPRAPIAPDLPPDHPLEPGMRPQDLQPSAAERAAASEAILNDTPMSAHESATKANFIAAARRAAQQAAATPAAAKPGRVAQLAERLRPAAAAPAANPAQSAFSSKLKALLVGASVIIIVLGSIRIAMNVMRESDTAKVPPPVETPDKSSAVLPPMQGKVIALPQRASERPAVVASSADPAIQFAPAAGALGVPPKVVAKVMDRAGETVAKRTGPAEPAPIGIPATQIAAVAATEVTGSVAAQPAPVRVVAAAPTARAPETTATASAAYPDQLPEAIGSAALRSAAMKGDAKAAYEIASRYADGKGVTANYAEAIKWFDRAAQKGLVPAQFRLGSLYEKGLGTGKDIGAAKRSYIAAAEGGNAKAMHNLAVLFADGNGQGPDYKTASEWFRKAADYGLADSQYNLAVLYARGIGVDQNLIESFKWFSLAAAQGDADAGKKRDDVAKRMDPQSLAAARLAVQTFVPLTQPDGAVNVAGPGNGWDGAPAPVAKSVSRKK